MTYNEYLDLTWCDRLYANLELDDLIERSNEEGKGRPKEDR